jgi:Amt family ammonium transporter
LVAITACCDLVSNPIAIVVGITAAGVTKTVSILLRKRKIDDAVDAIAVHGGAGLWGTLCVGLFGNVDSRYSQILVQLLGVSVALLWGAGLTWVILVFLNRWQPMRVSLEDETIGLNITEIGHIATRYNQVIDSLERNHRENAESLEELYAITATAVAAIENRHFDPENFASFGDRPDELGILARSLQQMLTTINEQETALKQLHISQQDTLKLMLSEIFYRRFGKPVGFYQAQLDKLPIGSMSAMVAQAIAAESFEDFQIKATNNDLISDI